MAVKFGVKTTIMCTFKQWFNVLNQFWSQPGCCRQQHSKANFLTLQDSNGQFIRNSLWRKIFQYLIKSTCFNQNHVHDTRISMNQMLVKPQVQTTYYEENSFNPLMTGGNKKVIYTSAAGLLMCVTFLLLPGISGVN